ncbi:involucrin repeat protein [Aspergillus clavatus NRRL 1]|uniref:Involucrin repeat protein n=1 Tax=Aspergillus clavatus (strain ATCC 1007 / CBS 513.65 / DSM 816 / NCTC 3887 / NRRL 1 / QM 1276 / 107) TaxID=344612 RepID=A1CI72_ASPCL|nr:involucrin repeat protein [Aspergillus clavatus NRRL 1]EAW10577.1 involucrin repeat protein [Aspergillus clavatus NRRL 1]
MMNDHDRFSQSSYGDPRYLSSTSFESPSAPPTRVLMDGYREALNPHNAEKSRYDPLNLTLPRSPALLNPNDPVAMYLLTETAIGDSMNYEILSLEEVEALKKEYTVLSSRLNATKRKLALEMKLRDAALSLSRLYTPTGTRDSEQYYSSTSPESHRGDFERGPLDKTDEELAVSTRKCENLAHEIWNLERKAQHLRQRLVEHTAGVLQMTHKGLKKNMKDVPHTPESLSSHNTRASVDEFDDRSLYKTSDNLDELAGFGARELLGSDAIHDTEKKLQVLSERLRDTILQLHPEADHGPIPQPSSDRGPVSSTATVEAHLAYIENGLSIVAANPSETPRALEQDPGTENDLREINTRLHHVVGQSGLSRSQALVPPPDSSSDGLKAQLDYLSLSIDDIHKQIEKLLEQKSILTTQIQQQRELNSKSDAERDAHIADLVEQIAHIRRDLELSEQEGQKAKQELELTIQQIAHTRKDLELSEQEGQKSKQELELTIQQIAHTRKDLELSEQEGQKSKQELELAIQQLDELRRENAGLQQHKSVADDQATALAFEKQARAQAEAEMASLQAIVHGLQQQKGAQGEAHEARVQAEQEAARLESQLEQLRSETVSHTEELTAARLKADSEVARLQNVIDQLHQEADARAEEATEARDRAEQQILQLEETIQHVRDEADTRVTDALESRAVAEGEVARLDASIQQLRTGMESQIRESSEARAHAEERSTHLQAELAAAEGELSRLQGTMEQLQKDMQTQLNDANETRTTAQDSAKRLQTELTEMEGELVRVQTELTMAKAELDGAYGSRSERAAKVAVNPAIQKELDALNTRNLELAEELAALKAGKPGSSDLQQRVQMLERELRETIDDYEVMTKASIEFEKERERYEGMIDGLRDRCEQLETQLNEERINWMGMMNNAVGQNGTYETTSTMVLKNEFKKMMRDTRIENMKILKAEQEERRRLEAFIRTLKKEQTASNGKSSLNHGVTAL